MTGLDIAVLALLGIAAILGAVRGFVQETLSLIAWVLAVLAVKFFHTPLTLVLEGPVGTAAGAAVAGFLLLFGGTFLLGRLLAGALGKRTRQSVLGPVDRVLGLGFGALKGLLAATLAFLAVTVVDDLIGGGPRNRPLWLRDSRTYPLLNATSRAMVDWLHRRRAETAAAATDAR